MNQKRAVAPAVTIAHRTIILLRLSQFIFSLLFVKVLAKMVIIISYIIEFVKYLSGLAFSQADGILAKRGILFCFWKF